MQFFPHIESGNSSSSSLSAGFFADKPTDGGFASLLSSHLDEHGMSGGSLEADTSAAQAKSSDSSAPAASLPKSSSSESESETSHKSTSSTGESVPEDSLEHEVLASAKEAARLEILAGDQKELSANPAASDARRKDLKREQDGLAAVTEGRGKEAVVQDIAGLLRKLEPLLGPNRQARMDAGDKSQAHGESISGALGQLHKLVDAARKKVVAAGEDAEKALHSKLEQIKAADLDAVQDGLRDILQTVKNTVGNSLREGKGGNAGQQVPVDALQLGSGKDVSLSAQDQDVLREALVRLESIKARVFGKEQPEQKHGPVRPAHKPETPAKIKPENKTAPHQTPGAIEIAAPGVQSKTQSASVPAGAVTAEKSMDQGVRSVSKLTSEDKTDQGLPSGVDEIAQSVQSRPAPGRDAATDKSAEQGARPVVGAVASESVADASEKQGGGKFFRDSASKRDDQSAGKPSGSPEKFEAVAPRETLDGGRLQNVKIPETEGAFTAQPNAASSLNTSGSAAKTRSAEVYRQVEAGAFRDLGQGNKQLVIRLDPPDLGQVSVVLQVRGKEVQAVLRTNNQEASQALADQLGQLRSQLESQGLRVSRLEVQTQLADSQTDSQWQGAEQHNRYQENRELAMTAQRLRSLGRVESTLAQDVQTSHHKENISLTGVDVFA